jgi:phosphate-selective porin OprO and OprP
MRKISLLTVAGLLLMPAVSEAKPLNELLADKGVLASTGTPGQAYYRGGTRLDFGSDFDMKLNLQVQSRYRYVDFDDSTETGRPDTSGFNMRRVRLILSGSMLDQTWSYKVNNDFVGGSNDDGSRSSDLLDAWLQWNGGDWVNFRMGQYKTPLGRQFNASSAKLQLMDRSPVTDLFDLGRQNGAMLHGGDGVAQYALGLFNGESDGEGRNLGPVDNRMQGVGMVSLSSDNYGSRGHEGDIDMTDGLAWTLGGAVGFGQGTSALGKFDKTDLNADIGLRCGGMSLQSEVYWSEIDFDDGMALGATGKRDDIGYYVQLGYQFVEEWEAAGRFSYIKLDKDVDPVKDMQEYNVGLNYYINGHNLKVQTGVSWTDTNFRGGGDLVDLAYQLQLAGYF